MRASGSTVYGRGISYVSAILLLLLVSEAPFLLGGYIYTYL